MNKKIKVIISGVQGYVGMSLLSLIKQHPYLELVGVHSRNSSTDELTQLSESADVIFLATPAEVSMEMVAFLKSKKIIIVDLSGAFRLPVHDFEKWYGLTHAAPEFLDEACYGLSPWVSNQSNYQLIANPGCYATCALMTLIPLLKANLIKSNAIIIDAKSGVSGSGKQVKPELMFCELANNFFPYKIGTHQHNPEITHFLQEFTGIATQIRLTTSILPITRGISMTVYTEASTAFNSDADLALAVEDAFHTAYKNYPLVQVANISTHQHHSILSLKNVVHTAHTHIGYFVQHGQITLFSCIDNLLKGAASQAIENINALYHLPLSTGLQPVKEAL